MAQNNTITLPAKTWTQITNGDITAARVQNTGTSDIFIQARAGEGSVDFPGAITLRQMEGIANLAMATEFAGVSGANRLYAFCLLGGEVSISHA